MARNCSIGARIHCGLLADIHNLFVHLQAVIGHQEGLDTCDLFLVAQQPWKLSPIRSVGDDQIFEVAWSPRIVGGSSVETSMA